MPNPSVLTRNMFERRWGSTLPYVCTFCGEQITKRGQEPDSLVIHHVDNILRRDHSDLLEPMHLRCHGIYHNKNRSRT